jgi:hypothetical protein
MGHPLNLLAVHHSLAFHDLKKERLDQVDLLVSKHNVGETVTAQKQATGTHQKNTEQNAHYLLTIVTRSTKRASSKQPASKQKKVVSKMLTICSLSSLGENYEHEEHTLFHIPRLIDNREQQGSPPCGCPIHPRPSHDHGANQ